MKEKIRKKYDVPSTLSLGLPHTWLMMALMGTTTYFTALKSPMVFVLLMVLFNHIFLSWKTKQAKQLMFLFLGMTWIFNRLIYFPMLFEVCLIHDHGRVNSAFITAALDFLTKIIHDCDVSYTRPVVGNNLNTTDVITMVLDYIKTVSNIGFETTADRLRDIDISQSPLPISEKPTVSASDIVQQYNDLSWKTRWMVYVILAMFAFMLQGILPAVCVMLLPVLPGILENDQRIDIRPENKAAPLQNGIYKISSRIMGNTVSYGIGVVYDGIMHVPFHVNQGSEVQYKNALLKPYYINVDQDLVTYCGPPRFSQVETNDEIYVNTETQDSRTSYKIDGMDTNSAFSVLAWRGVTKPGESGSPVLALRGDEGNKTLVLIGQAGRYVRSEGQATEFSNVIGFEKAIEPEETRYKSILAHPGFGKTRKVISKEIERLLLKYKNGKVLVTGPTRVVCKEMYKALKNNYNVGLNIQGSQHKLKTARVQIAPHAVAVHMLTICAPELSSLAGIIIDEAHFDDPATIMLREMARYKMNFEEKELVEMSATLDGVNSNGSNFTINDHEIKTDDEARDVIQSVLEKDDTTRVLVFVPSVTGNRCKELASKFKEYGPVLLSRNTFQSGMKGVEDETKRLILSTDIAECGINVPNLGVVVDYGLKVGYEFNAGVVSHVSYPRTLSSRTQRRGRVGRTQPGEYYEIIRNGNPPAKTSAEYDADVLSTGRVWSNKGNEWDIQLSEKQFLKWLSVDIDESPLQIYITRDKLGNMYSREVIRSRMLEARKGDILIDRCETSSNCPCRGKWKYYDERMHTWLTERK